MGTGVLLPGVELHRRGQGAPLLAVVDALGIHNTALCRIEAQVAALQFGLQQGQVVRKNVEAGQVATFQQAQQVRGDVAK